MEERARKPINKYSLPLFNRIKNNGCLIIAHRGASSYYPENTMPAFEGAVALQADMIELDVMLSKDGIPIVFHDARLNAHTDGKGVVSKHTLKELKQLDAGSWFDAEFSGTSIPTLREVLDFACNTIPLNIEIKPEAVRDKVENGVEEKCLKLVQEYGMEDQVLFSSFAYRAILRLKERAPGLATALLFNRRLSGKKLPHELINKYQADVFNCSYLQITGKRLANLKRHQIPVCIYTVDKKRRMKKLLQKGVSGIFTNRPDVLLKIKKELLL